MKKSRLLSRKVCNLHDLLHDLNCKEWGKMGLEILLPSNKMRLPRSFTNLFAFDGYKLMLFALVFKRPYGQRSVSVLSCILFRKDRVLKRMQPLSGSVDGTCFLLVFRNGLCWS